MSGTTELNVNKSSSFYPFSQSFWQNIPAFVFGNKKMDSKASETESSPVDSLGKTFSRYQSLPGKRRPRAGELIELASFGVVEIENIERLGSGHEFRSLDLENPTWCDRCGDLIWCIGLSQLAQCERCHFTCHTSCLSFITVDCQPLPLTSPEILKVEGNAVPIRIDAFERKDLLLLINEYNRHYPDMEMDFFSEDESTRVTGFIKVCMNLMRPINVISGTRPPSIYDALKQDETLYENRTLTSFYLPVDTMKALHVDTDMTARNVIVTLLRKFKVADSPLKYALYESFLEADGRSGLRRLEDSEVPLLLSLTWFRDGIAGRQFLLQENDGSGIDWNMFALPELENFVKILNLEEKEYLRQIKEKYSFSRKTIELIMEQRIPKTLTHEDDERYY